MDEKLKLLNRVKVDIRSILLTAPRGMQLNVFLKTYRDMLGQDVPFITLGFSKCEQFLKSIPDVVSFFYSSKLNDFVLTVVADSKTSHIEKLVSKQKVSKQNKLTVSKKKKQNISRVAMPTKSVQSTFRGSSVPHTVKHNVIKLIEMNRDGIMLDEFPIYYKQFFGTELDFTSMGFKALTTFLNAIEDITFVYENGKFVVKSSASTSNIKFTEKSHIKEPVATTPTYSGSSSVDSNIKSLPQEERIKLVNNAIHDNMKQNMQKILKMNPYGIWASDFQKSYEQLTGMKISFKDLGLSNLGDLVNALPNIFQFHTHDGYHLLFDAQSPMRILRMATFKESENTHTNKNFAFLNKFIFNVRKLLQEYPTGVTVESFSSVYNSSFNTLLVPTDFGFDSIEMLLSHIGEVIPSRLNTYNGTKYIKLGRDICTSVEYLKSKVINLVDKVPVDIVEKGTQFVRRSFQPTSVKAYVTVQVLEVQSPSSFWVQLVDEETTEAFIYIMNEMDDFYSRPCGDLYVMQDKDVIAGSMAAAIWAKDGSWHRILILEVFTQFVLANIVDYGAVHQVHKSNLRYLRKKFSTLPALAIKSCLAFIKPKNGDTWDAASCQNFSSFCHGKPLMAEVINMSSITTLSLCDTSGTTDVYAHMKLVKDGCASYCSQEVARRMILLEEVIEHSEKPNPVEDKKPLLNTSQNDPIETALAFVQSQSNATVTSNEALTNAILVSLTIFTKYGSSIDLNALERLLHSTTSRQREMCPTVSFPSACLNGHKTDSLDSASTSKDHQENQRNECNVNCANDDSSIFSDSDSSNIEIVAETTTIGVSSICAIHKICCNNGFKIHNVLLKNVCYIPCWEISKLIWTDEEVHFLERQLMEKEVLFPVMYTSECNYPELYNVIKGLYKDDGNGIVDMEPIGLFKLKNVPDILNMFECPTLVPTFKKMILQYSDEKK